MYMTRRGHSNIVYFKRLESAVRTMPKRAAALLDEYPRCSVILSSLEETPPNIEKFAEQICHRHT